jgi:dolichyl-phosphate beta-glucosyltransferase
VTSLVFPAYNPGPSVARTWAAVRDFFRARPDPWEAVFVCDGCTDGTAERLHALAAESNDPRLRVLSYTPNRGKGYAVRTGLLAARGDWRVFTDVDLAYGFGDVSRIADELKAGSAVAIASRDHPDSEMTLPVRMLGYVYRRRVQSRVFGAAARLLLSVPHRDTQAGLKGLTAATADHVLPRLSCDGFGFDCELLTACTKLGVPVTEVPVNVRYEDAASTTGAGTTVRMLRELWRIRRAWRRTTPDPIPGPTPVRRAA